MSRSETRPNSPSSRRSPHTRQQSWRRFPHPMNRRSTTSATGCTGRVLALAAGGLPFERIAVLLRAPEAYRVHLEEAFARANIPAHFVRGARRPDAAGRAFVALLTCAAEDLSARRFAEYLSLGQV